MKTTILNLNVSAKLLKEGVAFPFEKNGKPYHNEYLVRVSNPASGKSTSFHFFESEMSFINGKTEMSGRDLENALESFIMDACSGAGTFESFCDELGYDSDSRTAERIYKACKSSLTKFYKLGLDMDIWDFSTELNQIVNA